MLRNLMRLFGTSYATVHLLQNGMIHLAALDGELGFERLADHYPQPLDDTTSAGRAMLLKQVVQFAPLIDNPATPSATARFAREYRYNSIMSAPMIRGDEVIGGIVTARRDPIPFDDKQVALIKSFAAQAVIAIENARLLNELRQSLEQQTATADVLRVISSSPGELEPVFLAMLENATRICEAKFGTLFRFDGKNFHPAAQFNTPAAFLEALTQRGPFRPTPGIPLDHVMQTKQTVHSPDMTAEPVPGLVTKLAGARSLVAVPMLKDDALIGVIVIYRQEVRPFTDKQIALVQNFAAQAVIAIENTRLLNELRQRTTDLTESLEQQTATADVLRIISSSPGELDPVFQAVLENATRICDAKFGTMYFREGDAFRAVAMHGASPSYRASRLHAVVHPGPNTALGRTVQTRDVVQIEDVTADRAHSEGDPMRVAAVELGGVRTLLCVPMLKEQEIIGAIAIYREVVLPFTDKQINLVRNFAAQAVIAIENTRLLNELRETLQQQTATADVLKVISHSTFDLQTVLDTLVESATRLCEAYDGAILLRQDEQLNVKAHHGPIPVDFIGFPIQRGWVTGRAVTDRVPVHVHDLQASIQEFPDGTEMALRMGHRTTLAIPLMRENEAIGAIMVRRTEVKPFTDKQIELVSTFADQAVIAIENVRLFEEVQARTHELSQSVGELRALGDVSQAVNSTLDLETVLSTIVAKAVQLSGTEAGAIYGYDDHASEFRLRATYGMDKSLIEALTQRHIDLDDPDVAPVFAQREPVQIADLREEATSDLNEITLRAGYRARMAAPLLSGEDIVGMLVVRRRAPGEFAKNTIDLIKTFAAQSALAIQNARLFHEIEDKSRQLEEASQHKSQFLANMSHELRTPLNAILGYTELMTDGAYGEPSEKMMGVLKRLEANGRHLLGLINDVLDLSKIEAGQLVLELSDYCIRDIAQTVRSTLEPLAAEKKLGFKLELSQELPPGHGDGRRLTQVLINLVGNAIKFPDAGEVAIKAEANNGSFSVSVRDTGPGISAVDQTELFQEFQQADNAITRKKGGTGLGLAISKRIIEMHGGRIWVDSQPGQGSTFAFTLPVIVERQVEAA
ncbi:MAG: GAF domain-containing protein [Xanthobacteraceae bacterium]